MAQTREYENSHAAVIPVTLEQLSERLKEDSGNVVLLNVWASWCKPCLEEMPALVKLEKKYADRGMRLIFIAIDDTEIIESKIKPILKKNGISFPTYILVNTPDNMFIDSMNPKWSGALPASFIYRRDGILDSMLVGGKSLQQFETVLSRLMER